MLPTMAPTREQAWATLTEYTKSEALRRHALAVEAAVRAYAHKFDEDEEFDDNEYRKISSAQTLSKTKRAMVANVSASRL